MKKNLQNIFKLLAATTAVICIFSGISIAEVGLKLKFHTGPRMVASYIEEEPELSLTMTPRSFPGFRTNQTKTKATESNFDANTIRFEGSYYKRGRYQQDLIPLSVDATEFLHYNRGRVYLDEFSGISTKSLTRVDRRGGGGLGINVALPKRLQKIFGEGDAGLKVSGYRKITFSGKSTWNDQETDAYSQSRFPTLHMEQISRFTITGNIGTKITVSVSQDSQVDIPLENRIQIRYKGDDDDILKSIEAGNTNLSLPNTEFVGYSSQINGLFGLKAEAQVGALSLTAIASQEKGTTDKTTITPTGDENPDYLRDYDYANRRIFDLVLDGELQDGDKITNVFVYQSLNTSQQDPSNNLANFYVNPDNKNSFTGENILHGNVIRVKKLDEDSYQFYSFPDSNKHYIYFKSSQSTNYHLGVYLEVERNGSTFSIGDISGEELDLKLLCPSESKADPNDATWSLMWRNTYRVAQGVDVDDLNLKIFKGLTGSENSKNNKDYLETGDGPYTYLEILGLDQYNTLGNKIPDDLMDDNQAVYRSDWGLVIFPEREPFNSDRVFVDENGNETVPIPEDERVPTIYSFENVTQKIEKSEYYIQLVTKSRSSIISLNRANIIEGSEKVTINGQALSKGTDYNIDYDFGQITLLSDRALDPNANLSIDFEYAPFFAVQKKTLLGARAEYEWSKDFSFGTTVLYKSDKAQERKPKVGQETANMLVFDADMSLKFQPNFLSKAVDALPLVETEAPSNFSISAEVAQSHPNPNVDNVAYVDDFESAANILSFGMYRVDWKHPSEPLQVLNSSQRYAKGKMIWHTPYNRPPISDIYDRETAAGEGAATVLRMTYRPHNYVLDTNDVDCENGILLDSTIYPASSWAGVMKAINKNSIDADKTKLFEMRVKFSETRYDPVGDSTYVVYNNDIKGKLHFDFGLINEDLNHDGNADTEDKDNNNTVDESEDIGLDGLSDAEEECYDPVNNPDPSGDNYYFLGEGKCPLPNCDEIDWNDPYSPYYYEFINGTEGNIDDGSSSAYPDKETLSSSNGANTEDSYFSYVLDFDSPDIEDYYLDSTLNDSTNWVTYRIPLRDSTTAAYQGTFSSVGTEPSWNKISYIRVWYEADASDSVTKTLDFAHWGFVQSNWTDTVRYASEANKMTEFVVATISDEDNTYEPHPDIEAYEDPQTNVTEPQKALSLNFKDLSAGDSCIVEKDLYSIDQYSGYGKLQMYVNGQIDEMISGKVQYFFRLGSDENNWYEFYTNIKPGWDEDNFLNIDFQELTALKDSALRTVGNNQSIDTVVSNEKYRFYGDPNINEIRFFSMGIVNLDTNETVTGEVWVDELRVTDVRRDVGTAARIRFNGTLADLFSYSFSLKSQDPYFRGLSTATRGGSDDNLGSGKDELLYNFGITLNFNKLLPKSWNSRIPISYNYSKSVYTPLLKTGTDILLPEEVRTDEQTVAETKSIRVSAQFKKSGSNPLFSALLNRLKTSYSYSRTNQRNPNNPYSFGENYSLSMDYDLNIKKMPRLPIFFWTKSIPLLKKISSTSLGIYPETWTAAGQFTRNLSVSDDISGSRRSSIKRQFTGNVNIGYKLFDNLTTSFKYETKRDLSDLDNVNLTLNKDKFKLGIETNYNQRFSASYNPKVFNFFTTSFSYGANYNDTWEKSNSSRRTNLSRNYSVTGQFDHVQFLGGQSSGKGGRGKIQPRDYTRRNPNLRRGGSKEAAKKEEKESTKIYEYPLIAIRKLTSWIDPIQYTYSKGYNNTLPGLLRRPSLKYRFGLADSPTDTESVVDGYSPSSGESHSIDLSSGFDFFGGITTQVKFKRSVSTDLVKVGRLTESKSTMWPDLNIRIQRFKKLPLIKGIVNKFIDVFAPRTKFSRQVKETIDLSSGNRTEYSVSRNHNPLLSVNFKVFRSLSLNSSYSYSTDSRDNHNQVTGDIESTSKSYKKSLSLSTNYSFSSPSGISIPLFGKLKFRSTVDLSLTLKINKQLSETIKPDTDPTLSVNKSEFSVAPKISYTFSSQIKGGITLRWQDTNDYKNNKTTHVRQVDLWTEIRF